MGSPSAPGYRPNGGSLPSPVHVRAKRRTLSFCSPEVAHVPRADCPCDCLGGGDRRSPLVLRRRRHRPGCAHLADRDVRARSHHRGCRASRLGGHRLAPQRRRAPALLAANRWLPLRCPVRLGRPRPELRRLDRRRCPPPRRDPRWRYRPHDRHRLDQRARLDRLGGCRPRAPRPPPLPHGPPVHGPWSCLRLGEALAPPGAGLLLARPHDHRPPLPPQGAPRDRRHRRR